MRDPYPTLSPDLVLPDETQEPVPAFHTHRVPRGPTIPDPLPDPASTPMGELGRYEDLGELGRGGMGEVRRVRDPALGRQVAMKIASLDDWDREGLARFLDEAQATAQLQHPGIVPVHEFGRLPDGRAYYTMKEIRGQTLDEIVAQVHHSDGGEWTFRRLLSAFHQACEAVGYAHSKGVIHRDLKPQNIMVGPWGEVLVLDWGLAKTLGAARTRDPEPVAVQGRDGEVYETVMGAVIGTPMYMSPEQAEGDLDSQGPASDVYSMGALMFLVLTGKPPFKAKGLWDVLAAVAVGDTDTLEGRYPIPDELAAICHTAMAVDMAQRYPNAGVLAERIGAWLEGETRRDRARALLSEADLHRPVIARRREDADALLREAAARLADLGPGASVEAHQAAWELQDQATRLRRAADLDELSYVQGLQSALRLAEDLTEAQERLADHYKARVEAAEAARDEAQAEQALVLLRGIDRGRHAAWIAGDGTISLRTTPPGAEVALYRTVLSGRRLVPIYERTLPRTPFTDARLPAGSWLLVVRAPGHAELRVPIFLGRLDRWGDDHPPLALPAAGALGPGDVPVPAGPFWSGGDPHAPGAGPRTSAWVDGYVMRRDPVTNAEYLQYLHDLAGRGRAMEAAERAPRNQDGVAGPYLWTPELPVTGVDLACARAYAAWLAERTGQPWRLPTPLEWEKAARGVDGRFYPWGDFLTPGFCAMGDSPHPGLRAVADVPYDESPYGVRGLAGNVRDWCEGSVDGQVRGGTWRDGPGPCRAAACAAINPQTRDSITGFRLVRSL